MTLVTKGLKQTSWSRALPEELTGARLVKKFPAFYETRRFITAFTSASQLFLSWARSFQSPSSSYFLKNYFVIGPGSSVGIVTGYGLDGPWIESRWGARFSAPVQTGPGAHPASCKMGTGSFPGVQSGRGVTLTPQSLLVPWSWKSRAIPLLPIWAVRTVQSLSVCTRVIFTLTFTLIHGLTLTCN